jgi:hypothetical protein
MSGAADDEVVVESGEPVTLLFDTFTETVDTAIQSHDPDIGPRCQALIYASPSSVIAGEGPNRYAVIASTDRLGFLATSTPRGPVWLFDNGDAAITIEFTVAATSAINASFIILTRANAMGGAGNIGFIVGWKANTGDAYVQIGSGKSTVTIFSQPAYRVPQVGDTLKVVDTGAVDGEGIISLYINDELVYTNPDGYTTVNTSDCGFGLLLPNATTIAVDNLMATTP